MPNEPLTTSEASALGILYTAGMGMTPTQINQKRRPARHGAQEARDMVEVLRSLKVKGFVHPVGPKWRITPSGMEAVDEYEQQFKPGPGGDVSGDDGACAAAR